MSNNGTNSSTFQRFAARLRAAGARAWRALPVRKPTSQARVLIATSHAISAAPDAGPLMATVLDQLDLLVPSASSSIHLLEGDTQRLVVFRAFPSAGPPVGSVWSRADIPLTAEIAETRRPLVVPDVRAEPRWTALPNMEYIRAWMGLPLLAQGDLLGFLMLDRQNAHAFTPADVELAGAFANQLALALRLARLATDNQRQLAELAALYELSRTGSMSLEFSRLLPELTQRLRAVINANACVVALVDEDGDLELAADGLLDHVALARPIAMDELPFVRDIITGRSPIVLHDVGDYATPGVAMRALEHSASVMGVPLLAQGEVVGAVLFGCAQQHHSYGDDTLLRAELAASHAALAIANARLLAMAQRHTRALVLRDEIRMAIAAAPPTVEALAHSVTTSLARAMGYSLADCWEVAEAQLVLLSSCDVSQERLHLPLTNGICASVAHSGRARLVPNVQADPEYLPSRDSDGEFSPLPERAAPAIVSEMCVPVLDDARVAMVLNVEHDQRLRQSDLRLLTDIAAQVGLALEHVRLVGEIRRVQAERAHSARVAAIGTLAAGVAHEFNNMLAALSGYAQLGLTGTHDEQIEALQVVEQIAHRGKYITSGLLSFAEPGSSNYTTAQLSDLCSQALRLIEQELVACGITIQRHYAPDVTVYVDQPKIVQALMHLLSNARDAMTHGGTLTLDSRQEGGWAVLSVADTGDGIVPTVRDHLFEPFVTTKGVLGGGSQGGIGLGLATSYGIVRRHGGTIDVASTPGHGCTFSVRLPLADPQHEEGKADRPVHVLVVEDDDVVQALLRATLVRAGYVVSLATGAADALARLRQEGIDVLIYDLGLPDGGSTELVRHLLAEHRTPPVILLATRTTASAPQAWHEVAVASVIQQPFQVHDVLTALEAVRKKLKTEH